MTKPLRILQITDTHLYATADGQLLGLNTLHCLQRVTELARRGPAPDLVVASGDLTHDATEEAYRRLRNCLKDLEAPVYCLPGNHDEAGMLKKHLQTPPIHTTSALIRGQWQLLFLDSTVAGKEGGHLAKPELAALASSLHEHPDLQTLIFVHHQPVPIGSSWLDSMAIDNPDKLFAVVDNHPQVRGIVWGHVHQEFDQTRKNVRLLATPSTCLQFTPQCETFSVDSLPPGFRWLELHREGRIETGVERLAEIPGTIDLTSRGY